MSPRLYRAYRFVTGVKRRVRRKMSRAGRLFMTFAALAMLFGFNTRLTMIYQLAALSVVLLLVSLPLSWFLSVGVRLRRILPETCTAGEKLTYLLQLENRGDKVTDGLIFTEQPDVGYPSYEEFTEAHEEGETERNFVDRRLGYYRWLWLLERKAGARFDSFALPRLVAGARVQLEVSLLPRRRGYIQLEGYTLHRLEPLGLFKKEILFRDGRKLLVLPKVYPVVRAELAGSRKYHQGGLSSAASCGESGEFLSLREYRAGDPVKHIDWKATARVGSAIVRQYQDEYFSRYGILLDTFTEQEDAVFEDAVSVAASIVGAQDVAESHVDLLFACDTCISSVSLGRGQAAQQHMLEVLACIRRCGKSTFSDLAEVVMAHTGVLSGLIVVLMTVDEERKRLLDYLAGRKIPYRAILITADSDNSRQQLQRLSLEDVVLFDCESEVKLVDLR